MDSAGRQPKSKGIRGPEEKKDEENRVFKALRRFYAIVFNAAILKKYVQVF